MRFKAYSIAALVALALAGCRPGSESDPSGLRGGDDYRIHPEDVLVKFDSVRSVNAFKKPEAVDVRFQVCLRNAFDENPYVATGQKFDVALQSSQERSADAIEFQSVELSPQGCLYSTRELKFDYFGAQTYLEFEFVVSKSDSDREDRIRIHINPWEYRDRDLFFHNTALLGKEPPSNTDGRPAEIVVEKNQVTYTRLNDGPLEVDRFMTLMSTRSFSLSFLPKLRTYRVPDNQVATERLDAGPLEVEFYVYSQSRHDEFGIYPLFHAARKKEIEGDGVVFRFDVPIEWREMPLLASRNSVQVSVKPGNGSGLGQVAYRGSIMAMNDTYNVSGENVESEEYEEVLSAPADERVFEKIGVGVKAEGHDQHLASSDLIDFFRRYYNLKLLTESPRLAGHFRNPAVQEQIDSVIERYFGFEGRAIDRHRVRAELANEFARKFCWFFFAPNSGAMTRLEDVDRLRASMSREDFHSSIWEVYEAVNRAESLHVTKESWKNGVRTAYRELESAYQSNDFTAFARFMTRFRAELLAVHEAMEEFWGGGKGLGYLGLDNNYERRMFDRTRQAVESGLASLAGEWEFTEEVDLALGNRLIRCERNAVDELEFRFSQHIMGEPVEERLVGYDPRVATWEMTYFREQATALETTSGFKDTEGSQDEREFSRGVGLNLPWLGSIVRGGWSSKGFEGIENFAMTELKERDGHRYRVTGFEAAQTSLRQIEVGFYAPIQRCVWITPIQPVDGFLGGFHLCHSKRIEKRMTESWYHIQDIVGPHDDALIETSDHRAVRFSKLVRGKARMEALKNFFVDWSDSAVLNLDRVDPQTLSIFDGGFGKFRRRFPVFANGGFPGVLDDIDYNQASDPESNPAVMDPSSR